MKLLKFSLSVVMAMVITCGAAHAQIILINFGGTTPTGTSTTNSPEQAANGTISGAVWNTLGLTGTTQTSLLNSGGTASGASLVEGFDTSTGGANPYTIGSNTIITLGNDVNTKSSALGGTVNTGVYSGTSVGRGAIFESDGSTNNSIGVQVGGLTAGTYDIYVSARNTNSNAAYNELVYGGASAAGNFNYGGFTQTGTLSYNGSNSTTSWANGTNYIELTVTLGAGQDLDVAVGGSSSSNAEYRGFLNSLEIVDVSSVPEPSTFALMGLGLAALVFTVRSRRARKEQVQTQRHSH